MADPILTIRIPLSSWNGIINGIEKWVGRSRFDDIEILADYEIVEPADRRERAADLIADYNTDAGDDD